MGIKLDRSRPFEIIYGSNHYGVRYRQDGRQFDTHDDEIVFIEHRRRLKLDTLNPFLTHGAIDPLHRKGIDDMKQHLKHGGTLPLIIVDMKGNITSGFKRYNAHKELGYETIECIQLERKR